MSKLTTFTIYNDGIDQIKINPEKFIEKLYAYSEGQLSKNTPTNFGHGYYANLVKVQKPRDKDDQTCYVHMSNTVVEMNPNSEETLDIMKHNSDYFDSIIKHMENTVKELKKIKKEQK
jgi:hypothetical protein